MPKKIDVPLVDDRFKHGDPIRPVVTSKTCPCPSFDGGQGLYTRHATCATCGHPRHHHPNLGHCTVEIPIPQNIGKWGAYMPGEDTFR